MKSLTEYRQDMANLSTKIGDIKALAISENRDLKADELDLITDMNDQIKSIKRMVDTLEDVETTTAELSKPTQKIEKINPSVRATITREQDKDKFASFGEFCSAVMNAEVRKYVDPRLSTRAASGLNEATPSDGGFLLDSEMSAGIMKNVWETGQILPKLDKVTLSGNKTTMKFNGLDETSRVDGSRNGGTRVYWKAEADQATASTPKWRRINLSLNKLMGLVYVTDELLDDAQALGQTIQGSLADDINFKLTDAVINGTGAGQPLGILASGCVVSVSKESGQAADTIVFENIVKMYSRLMASSRNNAIWVINQDCEPQLNTMSLAVGTGGIPVYQPPGGASASPYSRLMGLPVVPIEQCQSVGTTGDIMLCDFSKYKAIDKGGINNDISIHLRFDYGESVFRATYRFDGQPILASAITPFKGSNTLSHFVKLNSRD